MLCGGLALAIVGGLRGEWTTFDPATVSTRSVFAVLYLIVFGSLIAFSAYSWLVRAAAPALVATYAYVNPVVAVFLGWAIASERLDARSLVAGVLVLGAVALISSAHGGGAPSLLGARRRFRLGRRPPVAAATLSEGGGQSGDGESKRKAVA